MVRVYEFVACRYSPDFFVKKNRLDIPACEITS